jgi:hypothetical protein
VSSGGLPVTILGGPARRITTIVRLAWRTSASICWPLRLAAEFHEAQHVATVGTSEFDPLSPGRPAYDSGAALTGVVAIAPKVTTASATTTPKPPRGMWLLVI